MKFIVDAQLPRTLAKHLKELGHDAKHTWGLEDSNRTPDTDIARVADREQAVVITKDCDFLNTHILKQTPQRLLLVTTGNITNTQLLQAFEQHIDSIITALEQSNCVEFNQDGLMIHDS
jgi:predicted nuclease of predicted toxin-antitoxin system